AFLVSTKPSFFGEFYRHMSARIVPNWLKLEEIVRTGKPVMTANDNREGAEFFADFVEAIYPMSYATAKALGEHLKLAKAKKPVSVLDLAAGSGVWGITLAEESPHVRITAVDWPEVLDVTKRVANRRRRGPFDDHPRRLADRGLRRWSSSGDARPHP